MKKLFSGIILLMISTTLFSQNIESSTRKFIEEAKFTRINRDFTTVAEFKSGIGEYVNFYPIEVIDLKSGENINALELDMFIKNSDFNINITAWIGIEEINEFITFIEKYVIPNLERKYDNRSAEYIFNAKEITLSYLIYEKKRRLTIKLNSYDDSLFNKYTFWTETQVEKIPRLLEILKIIK